MRILITLLLLLVVGLYGQYERDYQLRDMRGKIYGIPGATDSVEKRGLWKVVSGIADSFYVGGSAGGYIQPLYSNNDITNSIKYLGIPPNGWRYVKLNAIPPGTSPSWDDSIAGLGLDVVFAPDKGEYILYYSGYSKDDTMSIGFATSKTLLQWTKYANNPVLGPNTSDPNAPDYGGLTYPQLVYENGKWYMFYAGFDTPGFEAGKSYVCLATADDIYGPWTRSPNNPIISPTSLYQGAYAIYRPKPVKHKGKYYILFNGGKTGDEDVYVAYSDKIDGGYTVVTPPIVDASLTGMEQNADPEVFLSGDYYYMLVWGTSTVILYTHYDDFPYGWKKYSTWWEISPTNQFRPTIVTTDFGKLLFTNDKDQSRNGISIFAPALISDLLKPQVVATFQNHPNDNYGSAYYHIFNVNTTSYKRAEGSQIWIYGNYLREQTAYLEGVIAFASYDGGGGGFMDFILLNETTGDTLYKAENFDPNNWQKFDISVMLQPKSDLTLNGDYIVVKMKVRTSGDVAYLLYYDFYLVTSGN